MFRSTLATRIFLELQFHHLAVYSKSSRFTLVLTCGSVYNCVCIHMYQLAQVYDVSGLSQPQTKVGYPFLLGNLYCHRFLILFYVLLKRNLLPEELYDSIFRPSRIK